MLIMSRKGLPKKPSTLPVMAGLTRHPLISNVPFFGGFRVKHGMMGFLEILCV
jgi:hypothetical protein